MAGGWFQGVQRHGKFEIVGERLIATDRYAIVEEFDRAAAEDVLLTVCFDGLHSRETRGKSPNDPKLSERGGWRECCAVGLLGAALVTAVAVRCSAWLGVAGLLQ